MDEFEAMKHDLEQAVGINNSLCGELLGLAKVNEQMLEALRQVMAKTSFWRLDYDDQEMLRNAFQAAEELVGNNKPAENSVAEDLLAAVKEMKASRAAIKVAEELKTRGG